MAKLDFVNRALVMLGGETVAAVNDTDSPNGAAANLVYQPTLNELLAEYPWRFAVRRVQLTQQVAAPPNSVYKYQYALPANTLRVVDVAIDSGRWEFYRDAAGNERRLYADDTVVWADVIVQYTSDDFPYPAHFERALVARLAMALAMPVTRRVDFYRLYAAIADAEVSRAKTQDWNEQPWPEMDDGDLILAARYAS